MQTTGQKLLALRKQKGYTQDDIAEKIGVSRFTYFRYENDLRIPSSDTMKMLSEIFDVSSDYLLGLEDSQKEHDEVMALREELRRRPEMKILFSASKKATKEDILSVAHLLERLKNSNGEF